LWLLRKGDEPDEQNAKGIPLTGLSNARPETKAIAEMVERYIKAMPFDMEELLKMKFSDKPVDGDWAK
jgi:arylsulfatase